MKENELFIGKNIFPLLENIKDNILELETELELMKGEIAELIFKYEKALLKEKKLKK